VTDGPPARSQRSCSQRLRHPTSAQPCTRKSAATPDFQISGEATAHRDARSDEL
jgi:hypothetical protein